MNELISGAPVKPTRIGAVMLKLTAAHDAIFSVNRKLALRRLVVKASVVTFVAHLSLIFLARSLLHPPVLIEMMGKNYLNAIATPFNLILFYEVFTLIATLSASTTRSLANQFEIVSLIYIRDVFRDVGAAAEFVRDHHVNSEALALLLHLSAGVLMYFFVALFEAVSQRRRRVDRSPDHAFVLERFVAQKKVCAIVLASILLGMVVYNLGLIATQMYRSAMKAASAVAQTSNFYNDFFTVMIFTDVLILILSLIVSARYENVFRNAAFVISVIMLRSSLTSKAPYDAPIALLAMAFGILTLLVFNFHCRVQNAVEER